MSHDNPTANNYNDKNIIVLLSSIIMENLTECTVICTYQNTVVYNFILLLLHQEDLFHTYTLNTHGHS